MSQPTAEAADDGNGEADQPAGDAAERLLNNDETMCRQRNPEAFQKLRRHILALYPLEERSIERVGAEQTKELLDEVRAALRKLRNQGRPGSAPLPPDDT